MAKDIIVIASALKDLYEKIYEESDDLTEMKMHKLLYFAQKAHYRNFGKWLFDDDFEGWVHGPVNRKVREYFCFLPDNYEITPEEEYTLRETIFDYGQYSAGALRNLSHLDSCYKISREGLDPNERGNTIIAKENIIRDIASENDDNVFEVE